MSAARWATTSVSSLPGCNPLDRHFEAPEFALHARRDGPVATVAVEGELDVATAPDLIAAIDALEPGYEELVSTSRACSFFASSGISVLLDENARATAEGFRFVVVKAPPAVQRIFDLTSLDDMIMFRSRSGERPCRMRSRRRASLVGWCLRRWWVMRIVREPRVEEVGVAVAVVLEGLGRGVELAAVEFDDEVVVSVDGVDFVAGDRLVELGEREVVALEEADEVVFEVGAGGAPLGRELGGAAARVSGEEGGQLVGGDESLDLGLVEGSGELLGGRTSARSTSVRRGVVTRMP